MLHFVVDSLRESASLERKKINEINTNNIVNESESSLNDNVDLENLDNERWDLIPIEDNNEDDNNNVRLYENSEIKLKDFVNDLMNVKIKSGISDRGHELYLSLIRKFLPQPNKLLATLEETRNFLKKEKILLADEAMYEELPNGKVVVYNTKRRIDNIFNMYMKEIILYTEEMLASAELKDSICGDFYRLMNNVHKDTFLIGLQLHFDGANFNKSNKSHRIFSISIKIMNLPISIRNKFQFYIPFAIFYGEEKPPLELMEEKILRSFEKYKFFEKSLFNYNGQEMNYYVQFSRYSTIKSHEVTHLAYVAKFHGPLNTFSTFAGE
uniref:Uncharacterized protein n=1 Tax=Strongyloides stercoralis TaxID=6248 RepID=A0AAF5DPB1_STRER